MNVLIDDNEKGVLCDFGLSRMKADVTTHTAMLGTAVITGSRNWMAPERLKGGSVRKPSDIYAFGMVIYEVNPQLSWSMIDLTSHHDKIYTKEIPLGHIAYGDFLELVAGQDARPDRPDEDEAPELSDDLWDLARSCWAKEPLLRPTAEGVCETISHLLEARAPDSLPVSSTADAHLGTTSAIYQPRDSWSPVSDPSTPTPRTVALPPPSTPLSPFGKDLMASVALRMTLEGHSKSVVGLAFSPDGKRIASCSEDYTIRTWDVQSGSNLLVLDKHTFAVRTVTFSPNGEKILSGSEDHTLRLWDAETGLCLSTYRGHTNSVWAAAFSPDAVRIASGSWDHSVKIWDPKTGRTLSTLTGHSECVRSVAFSPDGTRIASGSLDKTIRLWNAVTYEIVFGIKVDNIVFTVSFSHDSKQIISGSYDGTVQVWDAQTGMHAQLLDEHRNQSVGFVKSFPEDKWAVSSSDPKVRRSNVKVGSATSETSKSHLREEYECVAFSPDGRQIAWVSYDNTIQIWAFT